VRRKVQAQSGRNQQFGGPAAQIGVSREFAVDTPARPAHKQAILVIASGALLSRIRLGLALIVFALGGVLASIAPARADLRVCNQTTDPVSIAMGYRADKGWESEGWWVAQPSQCATVFQGNLNSRFYYLFAADDIGGGAWAGEVYMCTRDDSFTIFGVEDCLARGYERTGFFEVDTQNKTDWTLQLTDPTANAQPDNGTDAGGAPLPPPPDTTTPNGGNDHPAPTAPGGSATDTD
jgi:uncharacterized membrane protein